jgi:hypothetical protein
LDKVFVLGFPRYEDGATFAVRPGVVSGFKDYHKDRRILVNAEIEAGMSGGPVLDSSLKVIGIAKTGADTAGGLGDGYEHGAIPIDRALALKVVRVNSSDLTALLTKHRLAATTDDADVDNTVPLDNPVATWRELNEAEVATRLRGSFVAIHPVFGLVASGEDLETVVKKVAEMNLSEEVVFDRISE